MYATALYACTLAAVVFGAWYASRVLSAISEREPFEEDGGDDLTNPDADAPSRGETDPGDGADTEGAHRRHNDAGGARRPLRNSEQA